MRPEGPTRRFAVLAVLSLVAMVGCGDNGDDESEPSTPTTQADVLRGAPTTSGTGAAVVGTEAAVPPTEPSASAAGGTATPRGREELLRVALLIGGRANDGGFSQAMVDGLRQVADEDGAVEVVLREGLLAGGQTALEGAVRDFAGRDDIDLIVAHGFDLVDAVTRFAPEFPDARFATSLPIEGSPPNVTTYLSIFEDRGYSAGFITARTTTSGKTGYIGGPEVGFVQQIQFGFELALQEHAPEGMTIDNSVIYTGDFEDVEKGREAALSMIDSGVDSIFSILAGGNSGVLATCVDAGVICPGNSQFTYPLGPETVVASSVTNYTVLFPSWFDKVRADEWGGETIFLSLENGGITITVHESAADRFPDLESEVEEFLAAARAGEFEIPSAPDS